MVVITLEKCPLSLRGDLTKWLLEISLGVYVGQVSARVRDELWQRVCEEVKSGRATMAYSARNEQHLKFRVHNTVWEPIDFDGLVLMMRPNAKRLSEHASDAIGFSQASQMQKARASKRKENSKEPKEYVVVGIETSGLDPENDDIIEIGAIKVVLGDVVGQYQTLVQSDRDLSESITEVTGITNDDLAHGMDIEEALTNFVEFVENYPLVMHNSKYGTSFLEAALEEYDIEELDNNIIDIVSLSKKKNIGNERDTLDSLCSSLGIERNEKHRALDDCMKIRDLFSKLINI